MENISIMIRFTTFVGILSCVLGQLVPREIINFNSKVYKSKNWEKNGKIYEEKFNITKWKDKVPDVSKFYKKMFPKKIVGKPNEETLKRLIAETCVAESIHKFLILLSPCITKIIDGTDGVFYACLYALGNVPFILIQRYNRPRFISIYTKLKKKNNISKRTEETTVD